MAHKMSFCMHRDDLHPGSCHVTARWFVLFCFCFCFCVFVFCFVFGSVLVFASLFLGVLLGFLDERDSA